MNQNKTAQLPLGPGRAEAELEPSTKQVRGAEHREWPLLLWLFLLAAAPGNSGVPCQEQGKESDQEGNMGRICAAHTGMGVQENREHFWLKGREVMPSGSARKSRISSADRLALPSLWGHSSGN